MSLFSSKASPIDISDLSVRYQEPLLPPRKDDAFLLPMPIAYGQVRPTHLVLLWDRTVGPNRSYPPSRWHRGRVASDAKAFSSFGELGEVVGLSCLYSEP